MNLKVKNQRSSSYRDSINVDGGGGVNALVIHAGYVNFFSAMILTFIIRMRHYGE